MLRGVNDRSPRTWGQGFTLLETLISSALFALVIAGVYLLYTTMQTTLSRGELKTDLQQNARVGLNRMTQEIRMAGYDPSGAIPLVAVPPRAAIRAATPRCLSFVADVSASGASSQITYLLDGTILRRRQDVWNAATLAFSRGSAQPQAESMDLLSFAYYDEESQILTPARWASTQRCPPAAGASAVVAVQLTYWQMRQIRRVAVLLRARDSRPGVSSEFFTLTSDVRLRNR